MVEEEERGESTTKRVSREMDKAMRRYYLSK